MNQKDLFRVPNRPWWWPRSSRFRLVWIWVVLFVVLMTLQNLRVIATSVKPFVLGLPFSLFFMLLLSFISTIVIVSIYSLWKDFRKRVAD
jgi:hypothetical protein